MIKKILLLILTVIVIVVFGVTIYRYQILQYYGDMFIRKNLPGYISVEKIKFEFTASNLILQKFRIKNAPGFPAKNLLEIDEIKCYYRMRGKNILDGLEVVTAVFDKPSFIIERLSDGRLNLVEMQKVLNEDSAATTKASSSDNTMAANIASRVMGDKKISDIIKLPESFSINKGRIVFMDRLVSDPPHVLTFDNVVAGISPVFDDNYSKILNIASTGRGNINGDLNQSLDWDIKYNPRTPKLTMSNRFNVLNVDIAPFEPYYDRYSPIIFERGKFSGTLVFDFDNGSIGSSNEVHLYQFRFYVKRGYENAPFWEVSVPELVKYFSTASGEIVFDFKIKGDMAEPKFYLGPISKAAMTSMAVDKISQAIQKAAQKSSGGSTQSDAEKIQDVVDMFKGLMKKQ